MPLAVKINVALREQNCQKIGSERVKVNVILPVLNTLQAYLYVYNKHKAYQQSLYYRVLQSHNL